MSVQKRVSTDYIIRTINGGDSILLDSDSVIVEGNLTVTGNAVLTGNINADRIFNGTSNVEIASPSGNVTVAVGGTSDVTVFSTSGANIKGFANITGAITAASATVSGAVSAIGNVTGGNINSPGNLVLSGNSEVRQPTVRFLDTDDVVFPSQVLGAIEWYTSDATAPRVTNALRSVVSSETGNATIQILTSSGGAANVWVSVLASGNVGVANGAPLHNLAVGGTGYYASTLTAVGTVQGGNLETAGLVSATGNVTGGNITTAGLVSVIGNVVGGNVISTGAVSAGADGMLSTGNIRGGNILSDGIISASGNLTTTDIFASSLSLSGNVLSALNVSGNINAGNIDTALLVTNTIKSDDSTAVDFQDGIQASGDINSQAQISAAGNVTGNNIVATTTVTLAVFADDSARNAAITAPAAGMLIYHSGNVKFQGYTGATWVDLN